MELPDDRLGCGNSRNNKVMSMDALISFAAIGMCFVLIKYFDKSQRKLNRGSNYKGEA